ncbi:hypothetical protein PWG71_08205 [Nocardiopsis sp. N85]|uniref:hypothetical protein n=1 Tax=Nocardiopsis sp. N85 TaxID=3029400 RepID=UPI00237F9BD4|nr:hypothetical protein [Nocardiopsis sp. N85]MDE3721368.1 hypothetical protein [Nocardiopsis sp. N85]
MIKKIPGFLAALMALTLLAPPAQAHATHVLPAVAAEDYYAEINGVEYRVSQERSQT